MCAHLSWSAASLLLMLWLRRWEKFKGSLFCDVRTKDMANTGPVEGVWNFAQPHCCEKGFRLPFRLPPACRCWAPSQSALLAFGEIHPISKCFSLSNWTITFNGFCQTATNILWFITSSVIIWEMRNINIREFWYLLPRRTEAWMQPWLLELQRCNAALNVEVDEDEK